MEKLLIAFVFFSLVPAKLKQIELQLTILLKWKCKIEMKA